MLDSSEIKRIALEVGFDDCGIARADAITDGEYPLRQWLARGWNGDLDYMERNIEKRLDPRLLVPGARSVICCVSAYPPPDSGEWRMENGEKRIAAYARTRDYHVDIKQMLFALRERLGIDGKCCCDTVPISDKHWAARAGLGWIGRHTLLVTKRWGSWVNLGEIVTTEECSEYSDYSENSENSDFCAKCGRCVEACPNRALASEGPSMLNVTRCTSYYTTHRNRPLPPDVETHGYTQGCDLCQLACPFNRQQSRASAQ